MFGCFFRDRHGIDALDKVGIDNITFDYKILRGNAIRMLSLDRS